jgi:hypothetical protein
MAQLILEQGQIMVLKNYLIDFPAVGTVMIREALQDAVPEDFRHFAGLAAEQLQQAVADKFIPDGFIGVLAPGGNIGNGRIGVDVETAEEIDGLGNPFFEVVAELAFEDAATVITIKYPVGILLIAHLVHLIVKLLFKL